MASGAAKRAAGRSDIAARTHGSVGGIPAWIWVATVVSVSAGARAALGRQMVAPFIMVDELIYSELARGVAAGDGFVVRGVATAGYSYLYPLLVAPAYALFESLPAAYGAVKTINAVLMSLAAVPAYLIARRLVAPPLAVAAAALAVALPSLAYTGTVMTENAFYPLVLAFALSLQLVLERPTPLRQAGLLVVLALATLTRVQAASLAVAVLAAPPLHAWLARRSLRATLRPLAALYAVAAAAVLAVVAAQLARGRPLSGLLGAYSVVAGGGYDAGQAARFVLWHVAELDLYVGVLPAAAAVVVAARARRETPALQAFLAAAIPVVVVTTLVVAVFASRFASNRIQERNLFAVAPLVLVAMLVWVDRGLPRPRLASGLGVAAAALLPLTIPYGRFIEEAARSDTLALLPIWSAYGSLPFGSVDATVAIGAAIAAALFVGLPRRVAALAPAAVLAWLLLVSWNVWFGERGFRNASVGALFQGIRTGDRAWIDDAVGPHARVAVLWRGGPLPDRFTVDLNEFFNRSVGPVYWERSPTPGGLPETEVRVDARGVVRIAATGAPLRERFLLADSSLSPSGRAIARDENWGLTLWRLSGVVDTSRTAVAGIYPGDTWSGRVVTWRRDRCGGGTLTVRVSSDPNLFSTAQRVVARQERGAPRAVRFEPDETATLRVPLRARGGRCLVRFTVTPTAVPAEVVAGSADRRVLGAHFVDFFYEP